MKRTDLNIVSQTLGIDFKQFKNKTTLLTEIERIRNLKPSERCYNTQDPCTFEDLDDIDSNYLIEWNQFNHHFGADIRSLQRIFENDIALLPWSIDFYSGVQASQNIDEYYRIFDMKKVDVLYKAVKVYDESNPNANDDTEVSFDNEFIFEMERILTNNPYIYGSILNNILKCSVNKIYKNIYSSMLRVLYILQNQTENPTIQSEVYYYYCYLLYTVNAFHIKEKKAHLRYLLFVLNQFTDVMGPDSSFVLNLIFMDI